MRTVFLPSRKSTLGPGDGSEGTRADELSYIATGSRATPARATFFPCPLTLACALPETHAKTYARPSLAPSPCGPSLRMRAIGCRGQERAGRGELGLSLNPRPDRKERGAGRARARPRARSLWPSDRVRRVTSTPRGEALPRDCAGAAHWSSPSTILFLSEVAPPAAQRLLVKVFPLCRAGDAAMGLGGRMFVCRCSP